jgi:hypothetical protein
VGRTGWSRGRCRAAGTIVVVCLLAGRQARAVDPFEIQVYDASINPPMTAGIELHVNSVVSGLETAPPPELPPNHQTHLTAEPSLGLTTWWEVGGYVQSTIRPDGGFDFAGVKLRSKLALPPVPGSPFRWAVNFEVSWLPAAYDVARWGAEVRPIATASVASGRLFFAVNPILDWDLAGPNAAATPDLEPAVAGLFVVENLLSLGLEYYANFGPVGSWLPAEAQEQYLYEVINLDRWKRWDLNFGVGEGLTDASNRLVAKMILGFR